LQRAQGVLLAPKNLQGQTGVQFWIVQLPALELAVLIVFDEMMVRIAGKSQWIEQQSIHHRQFEQAQIGFGRRQVRRVEGDQIVTEQEGAAFGEIVEFGELRG